MIVESKEFPQGIFSTYNLKPSIDFLEVNQIHSNKIVFTEHAGTEADGLISRYDKSCAIKTADCLAVLFLGKDFYCVAHAGWRGLAKNILVDKQIFDISPQFIHIAPSISMKHYEVQEDFITAFPTAKINHLNRKNYFDLADHAHCQLQAYFPKAILSKSALCTFENPHLHSFRQNKTNERNWHIFIPHQ